MLTRLIIRNIALIDELEISLSEGLNVLSGETGAGKSIIVDSLNLALGERADRQLIRTDAKKAVVEAWFSNVDSNVLDVLKSQEIEIEYHEDLILSRELSISGKNVCRINGTLVTLSILKQVSDLLVDIHGQHEHQSLLNEKNHIGMLDDYAEGLDAYKAMTQEAYKSFNAVKKRLFSLSGNEGDRERRIDMLKFQIDEIEKAGISKGEAEELLVQKKRLNAAERIADALSGSYDMLFEDDENVLLKLKEISQRLQSLEDVDEKFVELAGKVDEAYYIAEEVASAISSEMSESYFDANELEEVEDRLSLISSLIKKYSDAAVDGEYITKAQQELEDLIGSEELIQKLSKQIDETKQDLYDASIALSKKRRQAAEDFAGKMQQQLFDLGMKDAQFSVNMREIPPIEECSFTKNGIDEVEFYISTNKGEPQKPLKKVASGGEVSRIMLALKNIATFDGGIPTMIFDEIDTGISGRMAEVVARKLGNIAACRQVVCVTHLPQIASMAETHFLIQKSSDEISTTTSLKKLCNEDRIYEVARLAGGDSSVSAQHAKEMIERAQNFKATI